MKLFKSALPMSFTLTPSFPAVAAVWQNNKVLTIVIGIIICAVVVNLTGNKQQLEAEAMAKSSQEEILKLSKEGEVKGIATVFKREQVVVMPIPSGKPTMWPTFTPTPTNTPTPTPTPSNTPTPTLTPTPTIFIPPPAPGEIDGYFKKYASEYSVDEALLRRIAACESGYNTTSHNKAHDYAGMFQFSHPTWVSTRNQMNDDPNPDLRFNAEQAIKTAAFKISRGGQKAWPNCQ